MVNFAVNPEGEIRFGLGAIKGSGESAVISIIEERESGGPFRNIFEFAERVNLRAVNKKTFECLAMSGAFDCFGDYHRRQYLQAPEGENTLIENVIRYANKMQLEAESAQASLFGGSSGVEIPKPKVTPIEPFGEIEKLNIEKEVVGLYISGHPLDKFEFEISNFCNTTLNELNNLEKLQNKEVRLAGIVSDFAHRTTKGGKPFGTITLEDYNGNFTFFLFGDDYLKFKEFMMKGWFLFVQGVVAAQKWGNNRLEFKIRKLEILNDLRDKRTKGIELVLNSQDLSPNMIDQIMVLCQDHKGNCQVEVRVRDESEDIQVGLISRKFKVDPTNELISSLKKIPEIRCRLKLS
jgi:DNA polymerase-3 subunit alpha